MTTKTKSKGKVAVKDVALGYHYTLMVSLVFAPSAFIVLLVAGTPAVVAFYAQALLTLTALTVGSFVSLFSTGLVAFGATLANFFNWQHNSWKQVTAITMAFSIATTVGFALFTGHTLLLFLAPVVTFVNWLLVQGSAFSRLQGAGGGGGAFSEELAVALTDYFAPASNYQVKPEKGKPYINERQRLIDARSHITKVTEIEPNVFKVDIRNNVPGKTDEKLMKELEAVAANLGFHEWEPVDEDPRAGFVTITVWRTVRTDATSTVSGMWMWTEGDTQ